MEDEIKNGAQSHSQSDIKNLLLKIWHSTKNMSKKIKFVVVTSIIAIILAAIPAFYVIKDHCKENNEPTPKELQKATIYKYINQIETDFHPESIPASLDTIKEVFYIRQFQYAALDYCTIWKQTDREDRYSRHFDKPQMELKEYLTNEFFRDSVLEESGGNILGSMVAEVGELTKKGKDNFIDRYKLEETLKCYKNKERISRNAREKSIEVARKGNIKEALQLWEDTQNLDECCKFDSIYFDFIIYMNTVFNMRIRQYSSNGVYTMDND